MKQHLLSFGYDRLKQTGEPGARKKTQNKWFETQDSISYWDDFNRQKIIYPVINKSMSFCIDNGSVFTNDKCFVLSGENINYLCAFLNSSIFKFCYRNNFPELGEAIELRKSVMDLIKIKEVSDDIDLLFKSIFEEKIESKRHNNVSNNLLCEIDEILFQLYGLDTFEKRTIGFIEIQ